MRRTEAAPIQQGQGERRGVAAAMLDEDPDRRAGYRRKSLSRDLPRQHKYEEPESRAQEDGRGKRAFEPTDEGFNPRTRKPDGSVLGDEKGLVHEKAQGSIDVYKRQLLCLLTGVGCFKGNLASQVGALYAPGDLRRADAFQIYYLFINAAVIAAPLIAGTLGEVYGWHYGFGAAGVGMLISLIIYRSGRKWLPPDGKKSRAGASARRPLSRSERKAVILLFVLLPVLAIGAIGNQQIFNAYMLWVPSNVSLVFFGRTMPTTWLITVDSTVSVTFLVASLAFWRLWSRRFKEPSEVIKIAIGLGSVSYTHLDVYKRQGLRGVALRRRPEIFKARHFRFWLEDSRGRTLGGVAWKMADRIPPLGVPLDLAVELNWNFFNDRRLLQLELVNWRSAQ